MDDSDIEELFYIPLKRKKIGDESIKNSQITYSSVRSQIYSKGSSQRLNQKKNQRKKNMSQISNQSKLKKNVSHTQVSIRSSPVSFKEPGNIKLYNKLNTTQNGKLTSRKTETIEKKFNKTKYEGSSDNGIMNFNNYNKNDNTSNNKITNTTITTTNTNKNINNKNNIFDDDDIPDIDFTQKIETYSSNNSDNGDKSSSEILIEKDFDTEKNPFDKEIVVQTDIDKVDSWLVTSVQNKLIAPIKAEVADWSCEDNKQEVADWSCEDNKQEVADWSCEDNKQKVADWSCEDTKQENIKSGLGTTKNSEKTCLHLHFHVNSPKKFIQPTIEHFFKKSSTSCVNKINPEAKSRKLNSNSEAVLKTWENILKTSERGKAGTSGISQNSSNFKKETEVAEKNKQKICPFYKRVEDTTFVVDGFNYGHIDGITSYFLSHFHYDHYMGLSKHFKKRIYCSKITANLVRLKLNVEARFINVLPLEEPRVIDGVEVTLYDANHCPGSVMFLFKLTSGKVILHVGDFRHHSNMESINAFWNRSIDVLYLDTTYLDPCFDFASQDDVLEKCESIVEEHTSFTKNTLFVVGSYTIGKEKVFKSIASKLDCKIYAEPYKEKILRCLNDPEIDNRLTNNKMKAQVHVIKNQDVSLYKLKKYMEVMQNSFKVLVAIKPTGWEHNFDVERNLSNLRPKQNGNIYVYGLPYSEHSSFSELRRFYQFIQPGKTIPTVNNGKQSLLKMEKFFKDWKRQSRSTFTR